MTHPVARGHDWRVLALLYACTRILRVAEDTAVVLEWRRLPYHFCMTLCNLALDRSPHFAQRVRTVLVKCTVTMGSI